MLDSQLQEIGDGSNVLPIFELASFYFPKSKCLLVQILQGTVVYVLPWEGGNLTFEYRAIRYHGAWIFINT